VGDFELHLCLPFFSGRHGLARTCMAYWLLSYTVKL